MSKDTGGNAFASVETYPDGTGRVYEHHHGMTLRDYFAAVALGPMVSHRVACNISYGNEVDIAKRAYEIADAMIAEREK